MVNEDHIKRLLAEGAYEIPDPRLPQVSEAPEQTQEAESEQSGEGEIKDEQSDTQEKSVTQGESRRPRRRKSSSQPEE